jgi:hypothetical protein
MRMSRVGGLLALLLLWISTASAQPRGEVGAIGFAQHYRPDAWVPMIVRLTPPGESGTFLLRVRQRDLDGDEVLFTRTVTLTAALEGQAREPQPFWMYFRPVPLAGGLPDSRTAGATLADLRARLTVELCDLEGRPIAPVAIADTVQNVDPPGAGAFDSTRGARLVLMVGSRLPPIQEATAPDLLGVVEDFVAVQVNAVRSLPEDVIGYEMVDAVVWLDADADELAAGGDARKAALEQYVRRGGRLVVTSPNELDRIAPLADWLPVTLQRSREIGAPEPLRSIALSLPARGGDRAANRSVQAWRELIGPFRVADAEPIADAIVEQWFELPDNPPRVAPWLARRLLGTGSVSWVAQDLSDPRFRVASHGWSRIWDVVLDYPNDPRPEPTDADRVVLGSAPGRDLGVAALQGMDITEQSVALISITLLFFIAYWVLAGPLAYLVLASKGRTSWSWLVFAACAGLATLATVGVVSLVLRGPPQLRHVSVARIDATGAATIDSRFGLYIPQDGVQSVSIAPASSDAGAASLSGADATGWITPFAMHPQHLKDRVAVLAPQEYAVDVSTPATLDVPYRSTLKRLEASWQGPLDARILGSVRTAQSNLLSGRLTNRTGVPLRDVYLVFREPNLAADHAVYLPLWQADESLELAEVMGRLDPSGTRYPIVPDFNNTPDDRRLARGRIGANWTRYWYEKLRQTSFGETAFIDDTGRSPVAPVLLSIFDRLPPMRSNADRRDRVELLRRGARGWDASAAVSAGALLIVAETDDHPIPLPLRVEGEPVPGSGRMIWQFVIPIDRGRPQPPTPDNP